MTDRSELIGMRAVWQYVGRQRPDFAETPGPGQESVWDYPRPPVAVEDTRLVEVRAGGILIARSRRAIRILETASPPTFYLPPDDVRRHLLRAAPSRSVCEWKGRARYFDLVTPGRLIRQAAWAYPDPNAEFTEIRDYLAFYADRLACYVAGERVRAQAGGFYGGWITRDVLGPFKGEPRTAGW